MNNMKRLVGKVGILKKWRWDEEQKITTPKKKEEKRIVIKTIIKKAN